MYLLHIMKNVACGIMYNEHNQILLGKRHSNGPYPNIWEFPGGKLEKGETLEECLKREWLEELNLNIVIDTKLVSLVSDIDNKITCHFFIGGILDLSNLQMNVHECVEFFYPSQMKQLQLFKGDEQIVDMLTNIVPFS